MVHLILRVSGFEVSVIVAQVKVCSAQVSLLFSNVIWNDKMALWRCQILRSSELFRQIDWNRHFVVLICITWLEAVLGVRASCYTLVMDLYVNLVGQILVCHGTGIVVEAAGLSSTVLLLTEVRCIGISTKLEMGLSQFFSVLLALLKWFVSLAGVMGFVNVLGHRFVVIGIAAVTELGYSILSNAVLFFLNPLFLAWDAHLGFLFNLFVVLSCSCSVIKVIWSEWEIRASHCLFNLSIGALLR